jgi:AraC-like DNA-binding protein
MIKTYNKFTEESIIRFEIARMEDHFEQRAGKADEPHRHNYYTVILIKNASGKHIIDFNEHPLEPNNIFFVAPGQVHQVIEDSKPEGYVLLFSESFLLENGLDKSLLDEMNLFNEFGSSPPLSLEENEIIKLCRMSEEIIEIINSNIKFKQDAIAALLRLFFIYSNNFCTLDEKNPQIKTAAHQLFKNFKELIEVNYQRWHQTSDYAEALFVTPDHLNRVVKTLTNKTAKEFIQSKITTEAKRLMYFTQGSSKEIAYYLGFSEPANFSNFFKKCTGYPPSKYKIVK